MRPAPRGCRRGSHTEPFYASALSTHDRCSGRDGRARPLRREDPHYRCGSSKQPLEPRWARAADERISREATRGSDNYWRRSEYHDPRITESQIVDNRACQTGFAAAEALRSAPMGRPIQPSRASRIRSRWSEFVRQANLYLLEAMARLHATEPGLDRSARIEAGSRIGAQIGRAHV